MSKQTKLMSKLLGSSASVEFKNKVFSAMDEAHENGYSTIDEDGELLQFAEVDDDIIVEDQVNDNELTRISSNPDDENDFVLTEVEVPAEEPTEAPTEEVKTESENLESITIERIPGKDGDVAEDILPDYQVEIIPGIGTENETPIEASYSMKFKNYSKTKADRLSKLFSECVGCLEGIVKDAKVDEDVRVQVSDKGEVRIMSLHVGKGSKTFSEEPKNEADLTELIDKINELDKKVEEGLTKEAAEEVKSECDKAMSDIESLESNGAKLYSLKSLVKKFSADAADVLDKEEPKEEPTEEPTEAPTEETKTESAKTVTQCPNTGKWFVEGDETPYETEEEAKEAAEKAATKEFSDPTVTVTIENLEPASVSKLLDGSAGEEKEPEYPSEETSPEISPNAGEQGRQFSLKENNKYNNPLLDTIW